MRRRVIMTALLGLVAFSSTGCGYNAIQAKDEAVNKAASLIKVQLQRRFDLIPNLVETVKGFAKQEQAVFGQIAEARAKLGGAIQTGKMGDMADANQGLTSALGRLLVITENYPDLKSNQNFRDLQSQLEGTENRISVARQDYNGAVNDYNQYIRTFPVNLTAKMFGQGKPREYFDLSTKKAEDAPQVKFN